LRLWVKTRPLLSCKTLCLNLRQQYEQEINETWSPNDKSLLGRLVEICDNIYSLGNGNKISESDILKEIEKLIIDLQQ
jgi:hypothetical protein